ncbi:hypothetical protein ScPMuIL_016962 [Solemya velum]
MALDTTNSLTSRDPLRTLSLDLEDNTVTRNGQNTISSVQLCEMMKLQKRQKRMCRKGRGIAHTLVEATRIAAWECTFQFQYDRWNCSLEDKYRQSILKKGFKEASFLYAVSSAGLVHAFARACSRGSLDRCTCDESKNLKNREAWQWGGCGDNIRFGLKFTRKFIHRAKRSGKDVLAKVNQHNSRLGLKVVKGKVNTTCKCHGVSGSCTVRTCWRQLAPFHHIGHALKEKYENSFKVVTYTNQAMGKSQLVKRLKGSNDISQSAAPRTGDLVYIEKSPSFCEKNSYSPGTSGRVCHKERNCDVMCCGRGYNVQATTVKRRCQCQVVWCCQVNCRQCEDREEVYMCK